ncbi:Ankyrin repeat domain-containing protein 2 [Monoraphidium neglectum]|uniref:Ankyrin repeat domain-containing protein 2 n=1 Tax=Monoraphidium neglectum TaxID=145388 RepID=A0A0D2MG75_9CHLO|nr:Ankyrin repeat domain-containing protein 2 [Monoraphidium neglectum]KIY99706.1 Ankyrin repeat domain-containing protein 2 [Monoraphidium neglectum]|eukprot:XP_013898726.1 Ankyrin repeat domain-containing protein 2 [Monoraphidium neglectum]
MAEKIAGDPAFQGLTSQLQESMAGLVGPEGAAAGAGAGAGGMPGIPGMPGMPGMPDPSQFDPSKYMQAMSGMFSNPAFMQMAEQLGQAIISSDPNMSKMMAAMQDPEYKNKVESAMKSLKDDPEMGGIFEELEKAGPAAMMKYWNDPAVLSKLGGAMGDVFDFEALMPGGAGGGGGEEGEEGDEAEGEEVPNLHSAASEGDAAKLKELLAEEGVNVDEQDEEGRTALHFAAGYGELDCAKQLIEKAGGVAGGSRAASAPRFTAGPAPAAGPGGRTAASPCLIAFSGWGASVDLLDNNKNTALHYAAGYGQAESVRLLLDSGADKAAKNEDDKTALEVAQLNEHTEVVELLQ